MTVLELEEEQDIRISVVFQPVLRHWKAVLRGALGIGAVAVVVVLLLPRQYVAKAALVTVTNGRTFSLSGGLASSLLGGRSDFGLQSYPQLIVKIAELNQVLMDVANAKVASDGKELVADRLFGRDGRPDEDAEVVKEISKIVSTDYDKASGIIYLTVTHRDSALARAVNRALVASITDAFQRATRTQATMLRQAQEARVDSASRQLVHAEEELVDFLAANRVVPPFSQVSVTRQRLQRQVDVAQSVYTQAMTDKEAAIAQELEETPAVVTLDPVPVQLPPKSRQIVAKVLLVEMAYFAIVVGVLMVLVWRRQRKDVGGLAT